MLYMSSINNGVDLGSWVEVEVRALFLVSAVIPQFGPCPRQILVVGEKIQEILCSRESLTASEALVTHAIVR